MPTTDNTPSQALHFASIHSFSVRATCLAVWFSAACLAAWPLPLAAADADDACKLLDKWLIDTGKATDAYTKAKDAADANKTAAPDDKKVLELAMDDRFKKPAPFHAELSSDSLPGDGAAWVVFEDKKLAEAAADKRCIKAFYKLKDQGPKDVPIRQVFPFEREGHPKSLKVIFHVDALASYLPYSRVDYLFVGALADTPPTYFTYGKQVKVANHRTTIWLAWAFVAVAYGFLAWTTYKRDPTIESGAERFLYAVSPVRISAASYGEASMSQVQVMLFTFVVAGLLFLLWLRTGVLSEISTDLLLLLGISAVGAGGAKFTQTQKTGLKRETARYLIGKGWYDWPLVSVGTRATLRNLLLTDERLDVYKFQMAIFTAVVACYVVTSGQTNLGDVTISTTMLSLIGISQGVYVGGKAITDRTTDLENAVQKMIDLEGEIRKLTDPAKANELAARTDEYRKAATLAVSEFTSLQNREVPKDQQGRIRPDILTPA